MKMKLEIKINIRQNILLGLVFLATMLFSCTVTQEINGFGGGFRTFKDKIEAQKNVPQKQEIKTLANNEKTETLEVIYKDFENSNSTDKVEVNTTINSKLASLKKAITTPTLTKLPKTNSLKQKIISKLIQIKLKHSKSKTKQSSSNGFIPDKNSDFGYWFLFVLCCIMSIIGTIFLLSIFGSTGWDSIGYAIGAIIFLPFALIHYIGLKNYAQLDECGFLYQFGYWTSMFAGILIIPLFIWLIGALTCGS
jgi:hypothetical protein